MNKSTLNKFYNKVTIAAAEGGYKIYLDDKFLTTPAKNILILPNENIANLVAQEFINQTSEIKPQQMFVTRMVNTAIDGVANDTQVIYEDLLRFTCYDSILYRAPYPVGLRELQEKSWDPILDWVKDTIGADFLVTQELISIQQPKESIALFGSFLKKITNPFALTAFYTITSIFKSSLLTSALLFDQITLEDAWNYSNIDDNWVDDQWKKDEEKQQIQQNNLAELTAAYNLFKASYN
ncbi:ATP12 family protein [Bartonella sp. DGB1]|uniref:ATP12 family protein n=1 Tax=Bartonella sp. DGB1 TaxID=3239807 RepID=UPI0035232F5D